MDLVTGVLLFFALSGGALSVFGLMWSSGERSSRKEAAELDGTGVEVAARLVLLEPLRGTTTLRAHYEYPSADGSTLRHTTGVAPSPVHVVGRAYPLVRLPRPSRKVHVGTRAAVRAELRDRERNAGHALRVTLAGLAVCALAVTGLVLGG
ncbi:hypothetical protein [Streptomyces termitum]|uniref:hypothetical protein n=1 Tax=Streptomyces termitum TaxID=67368 RepID=UPI0033A38453